MVTWVRILMWILVEMVIMTIIMMTILHLTDKRTIPFKILNPLISGGNCYLLAENTILTATRPW